MNYEKHLISEYTIVAKNVSVPVEMYRAGGKSKIRVTYKNKRYTVTNPDDANINKSQKAILFSNGTATVQK